MNFDVSVVIPTWNRLWSLPKAIASCRDAAVNVQIVVANDGSDDGTWEWLQEQPDVLAIQTGGWGKPFAVNRAFAACTGTYVRFLDSDDWLPKGTLAEQVLLAEKHSADVVVAGYDISRDEQRERFIPWEPTDDFIAQQLGEGEASHYSAFTFRRSFVEDIPHRTLFAAPGFASRDDRCFMIEVAMKHPKIVVAPSPGLAHRHHGKQRLQFAQGLNAVGTNIQHLALYRQAVRTLELRGELTPRRKRAVCSTMWPLAHWISCTHPAEGYATAKWVHQLCPEFIPPERGILGLLYRRAGFRFTERVLRVRRAMLALPRSSLFSNTTP